MLHLKKLSLLVIAATALLAFVGVSSAAAAQFTAGASGQSISSETKEQHVLGITGSTVKCTTTKFEGKTEGTSYTEQHLHPVFEGCTAFGFSASMDLAGCDIVFKAPLDGVGKATVGLTGCTDGGIKITVNAGIIAKCTVFIPNQSISSAVSYQNVPGSALDMLMAATNITMHVTTSDGLCPLTEGGLHSNGTWTGKTRLSAASGIGWDA